MRFRPKNALVLVLSLFLTTLFFLASELRSASSSFSQGPQSEKELDLLADRNEATPTLLSKDDPEARALFACRGPSSSFTLYSSATQGEFSGELIFEGVSTALPCEYARLQSAYRCQNAEGDEALHILIHQNESSVFPGEMKSAFSMENFECEMLEQEI